MTPRKKTAIVLGTRPEIIKLAAVIHEAGRRKLNYFIIHTGQHYSYEMDSLFFKDLGLPKPHYRLNAGQNSGGSSHGAQTSYMMTEIEKIFLKEKPSCVIVQGDTNTVLSATLAAAKLPGIAIAHVEAGLRSYDRSMPEEINRIACDSVSDALFPPTQKAKNILLSEGVPGAKIVVTGNTIVDAVYENLKQATKKIRLKNIHPSLSDEFFLMTLHRQENVDSETVLKSIFLALKQVYAIYGKNILFPMHPRTAKRIEEFGLELPKGVIAIKPVGFLEFLLLEKSASLILSDSGGVQEEACILRVPCVTLRTSTERPETVSVGANVIAGYKPENIVKACKKMLSAKKTWKNPFGDGKASQRIWTALQKRNFS